MKRKMSNIDLADIIYSYSPTNSIIKLEVALNDSLAGSRASDGSRQNPNR